MYVELLGLPASGKSTIQKTCTQLSSRRGQDYVGLGEIDQADLQGVRIPGYVTRRAASRAIFRSEQFRQTYPEFVATVSEIFGNELVMFSLFMTTAARYLVYQSHREHMGDYYIDEGILHRAIHALNKHDARQAELKNSFITHLPPIDRIIFLEIDPVLCYERVTKRLAKRADKSPDDPDIKRRIMRAHGDLEMFAKRQDLMREICDELEKRDVNIIRLDTSGDEGKMSDESVEDLAQKLFG